MFTPRKLHLQTAQQDIYDPYTDDREMEFPRRNVVLKPSGLTADTDQRKDEYQEQQLEAMESLDSQTQPNYSLSQYHAIL